MKKYNYTKKMAEIANELADYWEKKGDPDMACYYKMVAGTFNSRVQNMPMDEANNEITLDQANILEHYKKSLEEKRRELS